MVFVAHISLISPPALPAPSPFIPVQRTIEPVAGGYIVLLGDCAASVSVETITIPPRAKHCNRQVRYDWFAGGLSPDYLETQLWGTVPSALSVLAKGATRTTATQSVPPCHRTVSYDGAWSCHRRVSRVSSRVLPPSTLSSCLLKVRVRLKAMFVFVQPLKQGLLYTMATLSRSWAELIK